MLKKVRRHLSNSLLASCCGCNSEAGFVTEGSIRLGVCSEGTYDVELEIADIGARGVRRNDLCIRRSSTRFDMQSALHVDLHGVTLKGSTWLLLQVSVFGRRNVKSGVSDIHVAESYCHRSGKLLYWGHVVLLRCSIL